MARQGWENALGDDDMLAMGRSRGGGFWSGFLRAVVGVFIVGALTAGTAYYLPLHRAHKALTEQYGALVKKSDSEQAELKRVKAQLAGAEADRDRLDAERGQQEAKQKADKERTSKLREVIASKLGAFTGKGRLAVVVRADTAAVVVAPALVRMQGAEVSEPGKVALCGIVKAMSAVGPLSYRIGAFVTRGEGATVREQASSRALSVARALEEKCAVPGTRILGAGFAQPPAAPEVPAATDLLELDVALL